MSALFLAISAAHGGRGHGHTAGSILFAFGHKVLMIAQRAAFYAENDLPFIWKPNFVANLIVEYQKDIKIYIGIVAIVSAYQYYRVTQSGQPRAGESQTDQSQPTASPGNDTVNRLVVQTGKGEAFLRNDEVDYVEASRNYVEVHAGDRSYLIRDTIANLETRLRHGPFVRSHRSYVVNLDQVAEIKLVDGALQILLKTGIKLPLSRGYREFFKKRLASA